MIEAKALFKRHMKEFEELIKDELQLEDIKTGDELFINVILYAACIVSETISRSMGDELFDQKTYENQGGLK